MASVEIKLYKHKAKKDGSHPIILQVIHERKKKTLWLGHYSKKEHWDEETNLPNKKHPNSTRLSVLLRNKLNAAEQAIIDLENDERPFTSSDIIAEISKDKKSGYITSYTNQVIRQLEKVGKIGNARVYRNTCNVFNEFLNGHDIQLKHINYVKLREFQDYLLEKGDKINTISVHLRTLRAIINRAIKEGVVSEKLYPFKNFKIKSEGTLKRAITKDDIEKLRTADIKEDHELIKARDYFLFCFYNRGMSFIDLAFLKVKNIQDGRINYTRKKTGQKFSIKLTLQATEIINKYSDLSDPDDFIFQVIRRKGQEYLDYRNAMRLMNKKLKILGKLAGIDVPITTYVSRHSWATIAKRAGIPTAIISEGLGHETEETTQIYLDSFDNKVLDDANELIISKP